MKKTIKYFSWINIVGLLTTNLVLIVFQSIDKDAWNSFYILINLLITIPFIISGILSIRNVENPNGNQINKILITVFLVLWIPTLILPFTHELGGLLICISILLFGLWGKFKLKNSFAKLIFLNAIGFVFLMLDSFIVFGFK